MGIDRSNNLKPSEVKRFSTKDILLHFINLMNPEKMKDASPELRASLISLGNSIAQIGKDLQNPLPQIIGTLKAHLGTPAKGSKGMDALIQLGNIENNYLPNLTIQKEELEKTRQTLQTQYQLLTAKGPSLDEARIANLVAEIERLRGGKLQSFLDLKETATETVNAMKEVVAKTAGKKVPETEHEEPIAVPGSAPPTPSA